jgi:thiol-disulfide isomerase/thioredoxin
VIIGQADGTGDWKNDVHLLVLKQPPVASSVPNHDEFFDPEEFQRIHARYRSEEQAARRRAERSYWVNFSADGSFRVDDVPPGTYELRINLTEPRKPGENRFGPVTPDKTIASLTREVTVPEIASEEPLDLGLLELNWKTPPTAQAPLVLDARSLDGKTFSLETLRGKFVLLNFWTTWSEHSQEQMAEVSLLRNKFKDDQRVVFLGVNLGESADRVKARARSNGYTTEQLILSGPALASVTEFLSLDALPSALLLNPKGQLIARDLKSDGLERALLSAFKRHSNTKDQP